MYHPIGLQTNYLFLTTSIVLMLIGGFGFLAWHDIYIYLRNPEHKKHSHLNLHTHVAFMATALISCAGFIIYWILEHTHTLSNQGIFAGFMNSIFNITSARSTGFSTTPIADLQVATLLLLMCLAFIGSSPNSTGSGIKTVTFALIIATIKAGLTGKTTISIRGRTIPRDQINKAAIIFVLSICLLLSALFLMLITEKEHSFLSIVFEVVNAYTNVGISLGLTPLLTFSGKIISMCSMLVGRIGALGFLLAFQSPSETHEFSYPEERVILN